MADWKLPFALLLSLATTAALAQEDLGQSEVVVTASRRAADDYDATVPFVGLRRQADFLVQTVSVTGDTRDAQKRHDEIYATVRNAIDLAARGTGIELSTGETVVEALTIANYRDLTFKSDNRPDAETVSFLLKTRLRPGVDARAALDRLTAFIKQVPPNGRALLEAKGDLTLSIVKPDQYRDQIVALVATDSTALARKFGDGYGVEVRGIDRPVEWSRASLSEVFLYLPYAVTVVPPRR